MFLTELVEKEGETMYSIEAIKRMNRDAAKAARGRLPYIAKCDGDVDVLSCPNFGDYRPKGWKLAERLFVDNSGSGSDNEPALTKRQFLGRVKAGFGYAIIEQGQFQLYVGVFEEVVKSARTTNRDCHRYIDERKPFKAHNLSGDFVNNGAYVVRSYGWYPIFVYSDGLWYENADRYSQTTARQMNQARPYDSTVVISNNEMQCRIDI